MEMWGELLTQKFCACVPPLQSTHFTVTGQKGEKEKNLYWGLGSFTDIFGIYSIVEYDG